jgi:hypothetical protein
MQAGAALAITLGRGLARAQGKTVEIDARDALPVALARILTGIPQAFESWWTPHTFEQAYRQGERWVGSSGVAIDIDFDDKRNRATPPELSRRAEALIAEGLFPGSLCYFTPGGFRLILPFLGMCVDAALVRRAARGACAMAEKSLRAHGLVDGSGGRGGYHVDYGASCDLARLFFLPNAIVKGVRRDAPMLIMRQEGYDPAELAAAAPLEELSPEGEEVIKSEPRAVSAAAEAIRAYNAQHARPWPRSGGECPACSHRDCFGTLPESNSARWSCFSADHGRTRCGVQGAACWHGDALDLDAHAEGLSPRDLLRREGYLIDEAEAAEISALDDKRRYLRSRSYHALVSILERNQRDILGGRRLEWNEMADMPALGRAPLTDNMVSEIRYEIERRFDSNEEGTAGLQFSSADTHAACMQLAACERYHPVRDYLAGLAWDGKQRIAYLPAIIGAEQTPLNKSMLRRWLISCVARPMAPGCKVDTVLVLVGKQGKMKSSFFRTLAGDDWFCEVAADIHSKDAYMTLAKSWIWEWAELEPLQRARDAGAAKSFISAAKDTYRKPYGRLTVEVKRSCVIVGTTNDVEFLSDETGARRFWPIRTEGVDIAQIAQWRDQLWAEAAAAWRAGELWWLSENEEKALCAVHQQHEVSDAWAESLVGFSEHRITDFTTADVLANALHKEIGTWTKGDEMRVARILRKAGFVQFKIHGGIRVWRRTQ